MIQTQLLEIIGQAEREAWEELDLSGQYLTKLPAAIGGLRQLIVLKLGYNPATRRRNYLTTLPDTLGQLTYLQLLDLSSNNLDRLPKGLRELTRLQLLDLSNNNLDRLPEWLGQLTNLQSLNLGGLKLGTLPEWLGQLPNLRSLDLSFNNLGNLPEWLGQLTHLQSLDLRANKLETLPEWLGQLINLQSLDLHANNLETLPEWLRELTSLQSLDLGLNSLETLPEWLRELTNLQSLGLGGLNLDTLPEWLRELSNLQSLYLHRLNLDTLPEWLGQLTNLQSLYLSSNNLDTLPEWLRELSNLQLLYLSNNNLDTLPEAIVNLPHLKTLYVSNNPISEPSPEVLGNALTSMFTPVDIDAVRRYYIQLRQAGPATFYEAKLLIIGEGGAGKTSLAHKLQAPDSALDPNEESTEGLDIVTWQFPLPVGDAGAGEYRVNVWDFGGQAIYFATHQFFLTKRSVYVLVTDTRRQHTDFYTWLHMQETFGADSPVLLLKNRNRRHGNHFTIENLPQLRERFANLKEVVELDLDNVPWEETWPQLLRELQHRFLGLEHVGKPRPRTWVQVRQALNGDERDTISRQQFLDLCQEQGIEREEDALQLSDYLHHLGDILHFQEDAVLADLVILKPTWGLDAVYRVLDNEAIVNNWGQFTYEDLRSLWHEPHYTGHHHQLLRLMQNFQLCYPLPDQTDTFIAPQLLGEEVPAYEWDGGDNLQLRYRYPIFMPRGILSRAIVKLHHRIENQTLVWRSGVILNDSYARAEVLERRGEGEIRIRIAGRNKRDLLMEVVRALDELHLGFPKLRYEKRIPCNCSTCSTLSEPHFFDLEELRERLAYRKETIECKKPPYDDVPIRGLLDDAALQLHAGPKDREHIFNIHGSSVTIGGKYEGDHITVGNIEDSSGVAIGREAQASVNTPPSAPPQTPKE